MSANSARRAALGVLIPATLAGSLAFALVPRGSDPQAPFAIPKNERGKPAQLARMAATAPLRPIVLKQGRSQLGSGPAEPTDGGDRPAAPARLAIPALDLNADIQPVASTDTGIEVPQVGRAGWFDEGPRPGEAGRSVIIGHLDSQDGPGLFALLPGAKPGTEIEITDEARVRHRFEVVGKAQVPKATFPSAAVYGPSSRPVLVLITCGGPYTPGVGYRDNVLVYARAV